MKNKFIILGIVFVALAGLAIWKHNKESGDTVVGTTEKLPTLPVVVKDKLTHVSIKRPDGTTVALEKKGADGEASWTMVEPLASAVDKMAVDTLMDKLMGLSVTGVASKRAATQEKLGTDAGHALLVTAKEGDKVVLELLVSLGDTRSGDTPVRLPNSEATWLVEGGIKHAFDKPTKDWRDKTITDFKAEEIKEVTLINESGTFKFAKKEDQWTLLPGSKPAKMAKLSSSKIESVVTSFFSLNAMDFADASSPTNTGIGTSKTRVILTLGEGQERHTVTLVLGAQVVDAGGTNKEEYFLGREGQNTTYTVPTYIKDKMNSKVDAFTDASETK